MSAFFVMKASIFWRSFCSESVSFSCCASSSVICWSSDCSSVWATFLRSSATRASSSLPWLSAWRAWVSSLTTDCSSFCDCICRRFFASTTSTASSSSSSSNASQGGGDYGGGYGKPKTTTSSAGATTGGGQTVKLTGGAGGSIAFAKSTLHAKAGKVTIVMANAKDAGIQ